MKKIVIILPTYNEKGNIIPLIKEIEKIFGQLNRYNGQILVVDDNSPDNTAEVVEGLVKQYRNINLISGQKQGLGAAYVRGMRYAIKHMNADIIFEMDADYSHNPQIIPQFIKKLEQGADFVIGSRYIKGGSIPKEWGLERKFFSIFGNLIARFGLMILKIKDWTSGYRAFNREVFLSAEDKLDKYTGYTFQIAFLHRVIQKGYQIAEVPLIFVDRKYGNSKFIPSEYIINSLLYIFLNSSFIKFIFVGTFGFILQTLIASTLIKLNLFPGLAVAIAAEFSIMSNFIFNQFWTFSHKQIKGKSRLLKKFIQFNGTSVGAVLIQFIAVSLGTYFFGDQYWFMFMVLSIVFLVIPYSYSIYHNIIWKETKTPSGSS